MNKLFDKDNVYQNAQSSALSLNTQVPMYRGKQTQIKFTGCLLFYFAWTLTLFAWQVNLEDPWSCEVLNWPGNWNPTGPGTSQI